MYWDIIDLIIKKADTRGIPGIPREFFFRDLFFPGSVIGLLFSLGRAFVMGVYRTHNAKARPQRIPENVGVPFLHFPDTICTKTRGPSRRDDGGVGKYRNAKPGPGICVGSPGFLFPDFCVVPQRHPGSPRLPWQPFFTCTVRTQTRTVDHFPDAICTKTRGPLIGGRCRRGGARPREAQAVPRPSPNRRARRLHVHWGQGSDCSTPWERGVTALIETAVSTVDTAVSITIRRDPLKFVFFGIIGKIQKVT